ncbi:MAG: OmpP1/FadL family transporter [Bacteroidota bacterium]
MKKIAIAILLNVCLLSAQDFNLTGAGARAEGFGGAFIGLADDATAVVWNPAGLAQLERAEASLVTRYISEGADYKYSFDPTLNEEESQGHFSLNFGSAALPLSIGGIKLVVAAAYQRQLDFYYSKSERYERTIGSTTYRVKNRQEDRGGVNTVTPAVAVRFSPMLSFGLSANIWMGDLDSKSRFEVENVGRNINAFVLDYSGLNFVFGGLVDFEGMKNGFPLKLGLTMRTPFRLDADGTYDIDEEMADILASPGEATFKMRQQIEMPFMLGVGASYRIGDNLTVAMDYEMRSYGNKKIKYEATYEPTGDVGTSEGDISESKSNFNELRVGAEYLIVLDNSVIPLRVGYKTVPTGYANYVFDSAIESFLPTNEQVTGSALSFGSGFIIDILAFDITYSSVSYIQKYGTLGEIDFATGTISSSVIIYF